QRSRLKVFIAEPHGPPVRSYRLKLVDWTNPLDRSRTGEYDAEADSPELALQLLIKAWDSGNRYPDGSLSYKVPFHVVAKEVNGTFPTDGSSTWDSVS